MEQDEIFGDYDRLSPQIVQRLVEERGLNIYDTFENKVRALNELDEAIDVNRNLYETWSYRKIYILARTRGINVIDFPTPGNQTEDDFYEILRALREYEEGIFEGPIDGDDGEKKYNYAQKRYAHFGEEEEPVQIFDDYDQLSPEIVQRLTEERGLPRFNNFEANTE